MSLIELSPIPVGVEFGSLEDILIYPNSTISPLNENKVFDLQFGIRMGLNRA